jgi:hypothetical protein
MALAEAPPAEEPETRFADPAASETSVARPLKPSAPKVHTNPVASPDEMAKVAAVLEMFSRAREARRPLVDQWKHNYRMLRNRYWRTNQRPGWMPSPQIPEIFPIIASLVAWMTDQRFRHEISPASLPHSLFQQIFQKMAEDLEVTLDASWQANREETEWGKTCWDGMIYGTGLTKTGWEPQLAGGLGDAITRRVDPFCFYPDPAATNESDGSYYIEARNMSLEDLDRRYPGAKQLLGESGGITHDLDAAPTQLDPSGSPLTQATSPAAISPATTPSYGQANSGRSTRNRLDTPVVTVLECWVRNYFPMTITDARSGEPIKASADGWRCIVVAGNRVLMDEPAENIWDHNGHPYDRWVPFDLGEFWGFSHVELLSSSQKAINRLLAALQQNVELTGNPILKEGQRGNTARQQITNRPGQRLNTTSVNEVEWMQPPNIQGSMIELLKYHLGRMEAISGINPTLKGGTPPGRPSATVVEASQDAGFTKIRMMLRNLEMALAGAGQKKASLIIEHYTTPRMLSLTGPAGEKTALALRGRHFTVPSDDGAVPLKFQLTVDGGSRRHISKAMREDRLVQLFTLGAVDAETLLTGLEIPNAGEIAAKAAQAQSEQEQQVPGRREKARA